MVKLLVLVKVCSWKLRQLTPIMLIGVRPKASRSKCRGGGLPICRHNDHNEEDPNMNERTTSQ